MFGGGFNAQCMSSSLKDAIKQLEQLIQIKSEMVERVKKEISEHLKSERNVQAHTRVEHIIQEENLVEAMEIIQMHCDLLYKKLGLIQSMTDLNPTLSEAVSTVIWAAGHLEVEVSELKTVANQLCHKYSKEYGNLCRSNQIGTVNDKVIQKLSDKSPPIFLVEKYLFDIAKEFDVEYQPDGIRFDTPQRYDETGFDNLDVVAASAIQESPVCPYPQNKGGFPDAEEIMRDIDVGSPCEAGRGPFPITDQIPGNNLVNSGNSDLPLPKMDFGFKEDLWNNNQNPETKDRLPDVTTASPGGKSDVADLTNRLQNSLP